MDNYAGQLHEITERAKSPLPKLKSVFEEMKEDAQKGFFRTIFPTYHFKYDVIKENVDFLKSMGFKIYLATWESTVGNGESYIMISWAKAGELLIDSELKEL